MGTIYIQSSIKISISVQPILRFGLMNLRGRNVDINDGEFMNSPLSWAYVP
jgi:hypothetical protein